MPKLFRSPFAVAVLRGNHAQEVLQFSRPVVALRGLPRCRTHLRDALRFRGQIPDDACDFLRPVGIGSDAETESFAKSDGVGLTRCHRHDGLAGGQDAVHLTRHHDSFQPPLHRDQVGIGCGKYRRDLARRKERQKSDVGGTGRLTFDFLALGSFADKHQANPVFAQLPGRGYDA